MGVIRDRGTKEKSRQKQWKVDYVEMAIDRGILRKKRKAKFFTSRPEADAFWHMKSLELERFEAGLTHVLPKRFDEFVTMMQETYFKHKSYEYQKGSRGPLRKMVSYFGETLIHKIMPSDIQTFLYQIRDEGLSSKTAKNYYYLLSTIFKQAMLRQHLEQNPLAKISAPEVVQRREVTAFSEIELVRILKDVQEELRIPIILLLHTGMRVGELFRIRVEQDVDFIANVVKVRSYEGHETKNRKSREIPLTPIARGLLSKIKVGPVWNNTYKSFYNKLRRFGKKVSINIHPHRFRHTFCSLNMSRGVPEPVIQSWLGHGSSQITRRYTHLSGHDQQWATLDVGSEFSHCKAVTK